MIKYPTIAFFSVLLYCTLIVSGCDLRQLQNHEQVNPSAVKEAPLRSEEKSFEAVSRSAITADFPPEFVDLSAGDSKSDEAVIAGLFEDKKNGVQICGAGVVSMLLADDNDGNKHQRFILKLKNGHTLLVAHNIDISPRLNGLAVGDKVEFYGEYYYNERGGGVHWTHHDPGGKHTDGWLKWNGGEFR